MYHEVLVIGGGAAGIIAAITAKDNNCNVAILEKNDRIAKKILITGNGRCNISNSCIDFSRYHSNNIDFFNTVLNTFNLKNTIDFFESLGLPLIKLDDEKIFPMSLQASSVVDILKLSLEDRSIPIYTNSKVMNIKKINNYFEVYTDNLKYKCKKIIIACGGKSAPNTGSDGSGFKLAELLGHTIIPTFPALVQLKSNYTRLKALSGVKFDGFASIYIDNIFIKKEFGEILFTDYGLSGPPILQISRIASEGILKNQTVTIKLDIIPSYSLENLKEFLENHWGLFSYRSVYTSFIGIINKKIIPILLKEANIQNIHKPCYELTWKEKNNIYSLLKSWEFEIYDTNSFKNSQVTSGGVNTKEICNTTLESKIIKNLYFAGEILDVDGDCGGFNLQWAWSSGFIAGKNASK
ncbi:ferredoxin--NADP reductase [Clostridium acetireducens DSM 10703]|uniref:Ferredoxin--NADP reductase n=1 Tax=Clostridium acetireducens DSM 10703 TaxID=1121290 RepID=A0A1E8EXV5_9CLOT|nr:NAD(P)/FAD-dependent oxidoreductase [Clostridium acetireducens]OFI05370.1 ferredoxin--NADP reductase [Clostridium acetireducens DSM 10703]